MVANQRWSLAHVLLYCIFLLFLTKPKQHFQDFSLNRLNLKWIDDEMWFHQRFRISNLDIRWQFINLIFRFFNENQIQSNKFSFDLTEICFCSKSVIETVNTTISKVNGITLTNNFRLWLPIVHITSKRQSYQLNNLRPIEL